MLEFDFIVQLMMLWTFTNFQNIDLIYDKVQLMIEDIFISFHY